MGNGIGKLTVCFTGGGGVEARRRHDMSLLISDPLDEGLGHSFCYVRPDPARLSSSKVHHNNNSAAAAAEQESTTFRAISGASISANTSTPLSTAFVDPYVYNTFDRAAAFESSTSFASIPLQPIPRNLIGGSNSVYSGPLPGQYSGLIIPGSGPMERGFMSGPIERGFMSGPLDNRAGLFSGPMEKDGSDPDQLHRSFSYGGFAFKPRSRKRSLIRVLQRAISKTRIYSRRGQNSMVAPIKNGALIKEHSQPDWILSSDKPNENLTVSSDGSLGEEDDDSLQQNLQWAQGKAGEDRVHVVVSDEHGWVFVGIYDGFNGPDAPDFLVSNLYSAVNKELKGLLWDDEKDKSEPIEISSSPVLLDTSNSIELGEERFGRERSCLNDDEAHHHPCVSKDESFDSNLKRRRGKNSRGRYRGVSKKWEENQRRWKCEWDKERLELDRRLKEQLNQSKSGCGNVINHGDVLKALAQALRKTEESYLGITDMMLKENPELALMGSCVLVMLMKGEDVYVLNVGDSRAVLAQKAEPDYGLGRVRQDLERINEETLHDLEASDEEERSNALANLTAVQLTVDHSTSAEEEVQRIRSEHPDDPCAVMNDRVKGSLKVTRAFGAGFLKQAKWNDALLEMFRIDYIGNSPYINCVPSLYHHRLGAKDRFLILCSDGLYQYLTNEEAVSEVELFIALQPEGDPAQHLVEEVMFRAAKKAGMDFHELLEIPQGDRRRYHDDVSIIVISLEGRIWRSFV
ncbi:Probable protein phosphatase 2C 4 [Linum perenne]